jgi:hypothetical protein
LYNCATPQGPGNDGPRVTAVEAIVAAWAASTADQRQLADDVTVMCAHAARCGPWRTLKPSMLSQVRGLGAGGRAASPVDFPRETTLDAIG